MQGKAGAVVEFGAKLDISVVNGWTRLEASSFDAYHESAGLPEAIERYYQRNGHYPARVLADKIDRNRANLTYCKERSIRLSGPALGRPKKDAQQDKKQNYRDECERVEVGRRFSLATRCYGLGLVTARLMDTTCHCIAMSILVLNLKKIQCALWNFCRWLLAQLGESKKMAFVQWTLKENTVPGFGTVFFLFQPVASAPSIFSDEKFDLLELDNLAHGFTPKDKDVQIDFSTAPAELAKVDVDDSKDSKPRAWKITGFDSAYLKEWFFLFVLCGYFKKLVALH